MWIRWISIDSHYLYVRKYYTVLYIPLLYGREDSLVENVFTLNGCVCCVCVMYISYRENKCKQINFVMLEEPSLA